MKIDEASKIKIFYYDFDSQIIVFPFRSLQLMGNGTASANFSECGNLKYLVDLSEDQ